MPTSPVAAQTATTTAATSVGAIQDFYRARGDAPLWLSPTAGDAAKHLVNTLADADVDGLDPAHYGVDALRSVLAKAATDPTSVQRADVMLSQAFVAYVDDLKRNATGGLIYNDAELKPKAPAAIDVLKGAATRPNLDQYVEDMGWMSPIYAQLRQALLDHKYSDDHQKEILSLNLERARALPGDKTDRYILVNAAQQRLYMVEHGKTVDSMRVVVGKTKYPTPMMAALIRYAALNPYWYVPSDLAGDDIAQFVVKYGLSYFDRYGYEVVSDWSKNPTIIDPTTVDWQGVMDGKVQVMIRQKPGPKNFMGRIKFMFPNPEGVYLHDNPERNLFEQSVRYFSGGCVRLEDAWRLSQWLFHRKLTWEGAGTEEPVYLDKPVPVYITYLTAMPDGSSIAYFDDAYGRDAAKMAAAGSATAASR